MVLLRIVFIIPFLRLLFKCPVCMYFQLSGFKKVLNYTKKVNEDVKYRRMLTREEVMPLVIIS